MAALAVVLAASGVLGGHYKWLFVVAEVVAILLLLANALHASKMQWHERWLESRQVAELLRVCIMLRGGRHRARDRRSRRGRLERLVCRGDRAQLRARFGRPHRSPGRRRRALIEEVRGQANWNASTSHRMHLASHRIERFGEVLFAIVLLSSIGWLLLWFLDEEVATALKYPLTTITAGLPAVATASYGIRVILDFEGVAGGPRTSRSGSTHCSRTGKRARRPPGRCRNSPAAQPTSC